MAIINPSPLSIKKSSDPNLANVRTTYSTTPGFETKIDPNGLTDQQKSSIADAYKSQ